MTENEKTDNRNYCLDFVKGIACICIILMHVRFPASWRTLMLSTMRFAVPFFFLVSGYYTFNLQKEGKDNANKKLKHIALIVAGASVLYIVFAGLEILLGGKTLNVHITKYIDFKLALQGPLPLLNEVSYGFGSIYNLVLFNVPTIIAPQMWFLFALLYVYLIYRIFVGKINKCFYLCIIFFGGGYILLAQIAYVAGFNVPTEWYRNWLFLGVPFFFAGRFIHEHQEAINIKNKWLILIVVITTVLCPIEMTLFGRVFGVHLCSIPQVLAIFILAVKNPQVFKNNPIRKMGTSCSMFMYVLHPLIWHTTVYIYALLGISENTVALYLMPPIVIIITLLLSILCYLVKTYFSRRKTSYA